MARIQPVDAAGLAVSDKGLSGRLSAPTDLQTPHPLWTAETNIPRRSPRELSPSYATERTRGFVRRSNFIDILRGRRTPTRAYFPSSFRSFLTLGLQVGCH